MKNEVFGIKDGVLIRYYENEKDDGNNDGMKKIGDLNKLLDKEGWLLVPKGVSKIGGLSNPFYNCGSLTSVVIPEGVTEISGEAFKGCTNVTPVSIPGSVKYIGYEAFAGCTSLTSFNISEGVRSIGRGAFARCTSLTDVSIPASVTELGTGTFAGCTSLKDVSIIPASMTEICTGAFAGCMSLKEIRYGGTRAQWAAVQRGASWCGISVKIIICTDGTSVDVGSNCDKDSIYFKIGA